MKEQRSTPVYNDNTSIKVPEQHDKHDTQTPSPLIKHPVRSFDMQETTTPIHHDTKSTATPRTQTTTQKARPLTIHVQSTIIDAEQLMHRTEFYYRTNSNFANVINGGILRRFARGTLEVVLEELEPNVLTDELIEEFRAALFEWLNDLYMQQSRRPGTRLATIRAQGNFDGYQGFHLKISRYA